MTRRATRLIWRYLGQLAEGSAPQGVREDLAEGFARFCRRRRRRLAARESTAGMAGALASISTRMLGENHAPPISGTPRPSNFGPTGVSRDRTDPDVNLRRPSRLLDRALHGNAADGPARHPRRRRSATRPAACLRGICAGQLERQIGDKTRFRRSRGRVRVLSGA